MKTRAIVNVVYGEKAAEEHAVTTRNHKAYAQRCGAEYIVLESAFKPVYGPSAKFHVVNVAKDYQQTLLLDVDTVVFRDVMSPFDVTPPGYWGFVDEGPLSKADQQHQQNMFAQIAEHLKTPPPVFSLNLNSGVLVLPSECDAYLPPKSPLPETWCIEQLWLSYQILTQNLPYVRMDPRLNWCKWFTFFDRGLPDAFIVHWNQRDNRLDMLKKLVAASPVR